MGQAVPVEEGAFPTNGQGRAGPDLKVDGTLRSCIRCYLRRRACKALCLDLFKLLYHLLSQGLLAEVCCNELLSPPRYFGRLAPVLDHIAHELLQVLAVRLGPLVP